MRIGRARERIWVGVSNGDIHAVAEGCSGGRCIRLSFGQADPNYRG